MSDIIDNDDDGMNFNCPICDQVILKEEQCIEDFCKHVKFMYLDSISEMEYCDDDIQAIYDKLEKEEAEYWESDASDNPTDEQNDYYDSDIMERLEDKLPIEITIHHITGYGMACGPTSFTVSVGIKS